MKTSNQLWYGAAGLVIVSVFFLTPPWTTTKTILGSVPLLLLVFFGVALCRAKNQREDLDDDDEPQE